MAIANYKSVILTKEGSNYLEIPHSWNDIPIANYKNVILTKEGSISDSQKHSSFFGMTIDQKKMRFKLNRIFLLINLPLK